LKIVSSFLTLYVSWTEERFVSQISKQTYGRERNTPLNGECR